MRVEKVLESNHAWHRIIEMGKEAKTSEGVKNHISDDIDDIVKTIIMKVENDFYAFCVRKEQLVDYNKVKEHFNTKKVRMATYDEVVEHSTSPPGGCCPLLVDCPVYMDESIPSLEKVSMGSGSLEHGLEMKTKDLIRIIEPEILDIGTKK